MVDGQWLMVIFPRKEREMFGCYCRILPNPLFWIVSIHLNVCLLISLGNYLYNWLFFALNCWFGSNLVASNRGLFSLVLIILVIVGNNTKKDLVVFDPASQMCVANGSACMERRLWDGLIQIFSQYFFTEQTLGTILNRDKISSGIFSPLADFSSQSASRKVDSLHQPLLPHYYDWPNHYWWVFGKVLTPPLVLLHREGLSYW